MVKKQLILYFDILGYKAMIEEFKDENQFLELIQSCIDQSLKILSIFDEIEYAMFSDNFIFVLPFHESDKDASAKLEQFLKLACILQVTFISNSLFIRGSITIGNIYVNKNNFVFGKGLVEAYMLENNEAKFPRIIFSEKLNDIIKKIHIKSHYYMIDFDKKYFLNYLSYYADLIINRDTSNFPEAKQIVAHLFFNHKYLILNSANEFANNIRVLNKYKWSMRYHNAFCISINLDKGDNSILIDADKFQDFDYEDLK